MTPGHQHHLAAGNSCPRRRPRGLLPWRQRHWHLRLHLDARGHPARVRASACGARSARSSWKARLLRLRQARHLRSRGALPQVMQACSADCRVPMGAPRPCPCASAVPWWAPQTRAKSLRPGLPSSPPRGLLASRPWCWIHSTGGSGRYLRRQAQQAAEPGGRQERSPSRRAPRRLALRTRAQTRCPPPCSRPAAPGQRGVRRCW
mmetsp:Transcript_17514/g.47262  ORF Transcript_17514/g.47262 Transcript_17514/m.47262 type:complete len:205 (-) Transcript_17514:1187-1801(-)